MAEISLHGVTKSFGKTEVIHKTDVTIDDGEFVVMVGPVGLRKVDAAAHDRGPRDHDDGEIRIAGKRVNEVEPKDRTLPWCSRTTRSTRT